MSDEPDTTAADPTPARPQLRVVRGEPDAVEVAALLAVVAASASPAEPVAPPRRGRWNDPAHLTRRTARPGPGGWTAALR